MSVILRPPSIRRIQQISLLAALATVQGVEDAVNLAMRIRWPNDVMAGEEKLGGILTEASSVNDEVEFVIAGLGLNCNAKVNDIVDSDNPATSLVELLGHPVDIDSIASSILQSLSELYSTWSNGQDITPLWKQKLGTLGKQVSVKMKTSETSFSGTAVSVTPEGNLVISSEGADHVLIAEETEWLRESP